MALTKVTGQVIKNTTDVTVGVLTVTNTLAVGGTVSIGGTLTYEDVTNVDAVGLITARNGIVVGSGITLSKDGDIFATGITTIGSHMAVGGVTPETFGGGHVTLEVAGSTTAQGGVFKSATSDSAGTGSSGTEMIMFTDNAKGAINVVSSDPLTFSTANTERVRISSSGNFGIGSNSPQVLLHIASATPTLRIHDTTNNFYSHISVDDSGSLTLDGDAGNGAGSSRIVFKTDGSEHARITNSSQFLVGVTAARTMLSGYTPSLQVEGTANSDSSVSIVENISAASGPSLWFGKTRGTSLSANTVVQSGDELGTIVFNGADGTDVQSMAAFIRASVDGTPGSNDMPGRITFHTTADGSDSPTERLRIDSSGNIGAGGITAPLWTSGGGIHLNDNYGIGFGNGGSGRPDFQIVTTAGSTLDFRCGFGADTADIVMTTNGTVGIGEDDPDGNTLLIRAASTVQTAKGHIMLTGDSATVGEGPQIVFSESGSTSQHAGAYIGHMREGSNSIGNLVFGTRATSGDANTVPLERLRITSAGKFGINRSSPQYAMHLSPADSETRIDLHMTNSTTGHTASDGVQFGYQNSAGAYIWNFENTDIYFGTSNTERARILASGGLTFNGDTSASNALNDYERGNWTPTVVQGGWNIHTNYYSKYVKIGNFVHVQFYIGVNGSGTGSSLILGGLPFNSDSNGYSAGTIDFGQGGVKGQYMRIESSSDDLYFFYPSENTSSSRIGLAANQIGASYIIGTIGYYTSQ